MGRVADAGRHGMYLLTLFALRPSNRLGARAANAGNGKCGNRLAQPAAPCHALSTVDGIAMRVLGHAHDHMPHELGIEIGIVQRTGDGKTTKLSSRKT